MQPCDLIVIEGGELLRPEKSISLTLYKEPIVQDRVTSTWLGKWHNNELKPYSNVVNISIRISASLTLIGIYLFSRLMAAPETV